MAEINANTLTGIAGEYFAAAELLRRGFLASITLRNSDSIDIHISKMDKERILGIQVKTKQHKGENWFVSKKAEYLKSENLFYIFIDLKEPGEIPDFYIVPSSDVAEYVSTTHKKWMEKPNRTGGTHADSSMRKFRDIEKKYLEKWNLLEQEYLR